MRPAQVVTSATLRAFEGVIDLRRRTDGQILCQLSYTDVLAVLTRDEALEAVVSASGRLKYLRDAEKPPERPRLPKQESYPPCDPLTYAKPLTPEHEKTRDSGFSGFLRYPQRSQQYGHPYPVFARQGAGL